MTQQAQAQVRIEALAQQIAVGIAGHLARTWRWRLGMAAAAFAGLVVLAGAVLGGVGAGR